MPTPKPPTGDMNGKEGKMLLKGSAGRISLPTVTEFDPYNDDRCNETGLDHFSGGGDEVY